MTFSRLNLEAFDDETASQPVESPEYKRGFDAGMASAEVTEAAHLKKSIEGISTTLSDMAFGYAEARVLLLDRIRPLLAQVSEAVLPQLAHDSFAAHLVDVLQNDFEATASKPVHIAVHPSAIPQLTEDLSDHADVFTFIADTTLSDGQARIKSTTAHIMINLPALIKALQTALTGLEPFERTQSNG